MSRRSSRRKFVWEAALCAAAATASKLHASPSLDRLPIVDCHIHLFDPGRPGGVPWPTPDDTVLYRPALPERYRALTRDQGVIAAIAVECSPLPSDNDWLLKTAASSDVVVGVIGDLDPAREEFTAQLERLATHPLFLGIRYGNLWRRDLGQHLDDPLFLANLKTFARHGLVFESANPNPKLVADLLRLASNIPDLRIVIDHLPQALPPQDRVQRAQYLATLKQLSERPNVFVKGSEILRRVEGTVPLTLSTYTPWLDTIWAMFGEDRLFFGSDWPNSDSLSPIADVFALARSYLATKSKAAERKYFFRNSIATYRWVARNQDQRSAASQ